MFFVDMEVEVTFFSSLFSPTVFFIDITDMELVISILISLLLSLIVPKISSMEDNNDCGWIGFISFGGIPRTYISFF